MRIIANGNFRKVKVMPFNISGRYRGAGSIELNDEVVKISGRHVLSLGARWGIGLGIFFGSLIISLASTGGAQYCAPGFIPLYFLMEYGILKREDLSIPYSAIQRYTADPRRNLIAISFNGNQWCTPAALKCENWNEVLRALREKAPHCDANPQAQAL